MVDRHGSYDAAINPSMIRAGACLRATLYVACLPLRLPGLDLHRPPHIEQLDHHAALSDLTQPLVLWFQPPSLPRRRPWLMYVATSTSRTRPFSASRVWSILILKTVARHFHGPTEQSQNCGRENIECLVFPGADKAKSRP